MCVFWGGVWGSARCVSATDRCNGARAYRHTRAQPAAQLRIWPQRLIAARLLVDAQAAATTPPCVDGAFALTAILSSDGHARVPIWVVFILIRVLSRECTGPGRARVRACGCAANGGSRCLLRTPKSAQARTSEVSRAALISHRREEAAVCWSCGHRSRPLQQRQRRGERVRRSLTAGGGGPLLRVAASECGLVDTPLF